MTKLTSVYGKYTCVAFINVILYEGEKYKEREKENETTNLEGDRTKKQQNQNYKLFPAGSH